MGRETFSVPRIPDTLAHANIRASAICVQDFRSQPPYQAYFIHTVVTINMCSTNQSTVAGELQMQCIRLCTQAATLQPDGDRDPWPLGWDTRRWIRDLIGTASHAEDSWA